MHEQQLGTYTETKAPYPATSEASKQRISEIEAVLATHPAIEDAAVFGIPNEEYGEEVKAVVQLMDGVCPTPQLAKELIGYCREALAGFKCPKSIDFDTSLPREPTGKLYKAKLRARYL